jgi:hypothetical protein
MKNTIELPTRQLEELYKQSAAIGATPGQIISHLLDDEFGGLRLDNSSQFSWAALQTQLQHLETILKSR